MSESLISTVYEIHCDLWGASVAWIESMQDGAMRLGADEAEEWVNPAFVGVMARTDDLGTAKQIDSYFRRCAALALYQGKREMAAEVARRDAAHASGQRFIRTR